MNTTKRHKVRRILKRSLLFLTTIALVLSAHSITFTTSSSTFTTSSWAAQAQTSHPFSGHVVVYVRNGDRWREAVITGYGSRYNSGATQPVWAYAIEYVDEQGGTERDVPSSRLRTIAEAQAQGLTDTVYDLTTQAGVDQMLEAHNQLRREVGVPDLIWSTELAELAQEWADVLISGPGLRHRPAAERDNGRIGENVSGSYWSAPGGALRSPRRAVQGWLEEKEDYDYASNTCASGKICGHYTQMIWAETTAVGCAVARNEDLTRDVWVCNYTPAGNIVGQRPY